MERKKVLITVKTYPLPSAKYDELVCTAGVTDTREFIRLYPINFRDLPFSQQYRKYQWIEVAVTKHRSDPRKDSFRPHQESIRILGKPIRADGGAWAERAKFILPMVCPSIEQLEERWQADRTSLGVVHPGEIRDMAVIPDSAQWKPSFRAALCQARLWDDRKKSRKPPRKVPFKFRYSFCCDDMRCTRGHRMEIHDWEVGALYWRLVDDGSTPEQAADQVRGKFFHELCGPQRDTHFFVGTVSQFPTWIVLGVFYPRRTSVRCNSNGSPGLFD